MLFSSILFLYYFLPITMLIYWLAPNKHKNLILFLVSLFFYAWGEPVYVFLMLLSIFANYKFGMAMGKNIENKSKILIYSVVFNIGLLIFFKYTGFILTNINNIFNINLNIPDIKLPLGISFFTFQALSYVIDVYRNDTKVQTSFMKLGLYVSAYPQLVAGPIVRYNTIADQIDNRTIDLKNIADGILRFTIGLGKKVIFANQFAQIADWIFSSNNSPSTAFGAWIGIIAYSLQIYYDFSGYSDMAIGLGKMMGFEYEENFNYPYISKSITEFWRRWHISLGTWFRDYLYIPLGGNRVNTKRNIFNLFIVWFVTGLWHGASWNFIIWGLYYFLLLIIEKYILRMEKLPKIISHIMTLILVALGWVIFRAETLTDGLNYILSMFNISLGTHRVMGSHIILNDYWYLFIMGIIGSTPIIKNIGKNLQMKTNRNIFILIVEIIIIIVILYIVTMYLVNSTYNPFIYFRF